MRRSIAFVIALMLVLTLIPAVALADSSGSCGDSATWTFVEATGTLTISGTGEVTSPVEWSSYLGFGDSVMAVEIGAGITFFRNAGLSSFSSLASITVAEGSTSFCVEGGVLFNIDKTELICYPAKKADTAYTVPETVTSIASLAFSGATALTEVTLPSGFALGSQQNFPRYFPGCESLVTINVHENNATLFSLDGLLFSKDGTELIICPPGKTGSPLIVPATVTSIGNGAFSDCAKLTGITLQSGLESIGIRVFMNCYELTDISFPATLESIGRIPFAVCPKLASITVAEGNTKYCAVDNVLFNIDKTELICYPAQKAGDSYVVPDTVAEISAQAFYQQAFLKKITFPDSVNSIGQEAFNMVVLKTVLFEGDAPTLGNYVFFDAFGDLTIQYYNGATGFDTAPWTDYILECLNKCGENATCTFDDASGVLTIAGTGEVTNAAGWESIKSNIKTVLVGSGITGICDSAFANCSSLLSAIFEGNAPSMGTDVFSGAASGFKVQYLEGATGFTPPWNGYTTELFEKCGPSAYWRFDEATGELAVFGKGEINNSGVWNTIKPRIKTALICEGITGMLGSLMESSELTSISLPTTFSPMYMSGDAFIECGKLTTITVAAGNKYLCVEDNILFDKEKTTLICYPGGKTETSYTVPDTVTTLSGFTFSGCDALESVTIHSGVSYISEAVFKGCSNLAEISVDGANTAYCSEDGVLFNKDKTKLICYPVGKAGTSYTVPESVTEIGESAFRGCTALTSVTLPNNLEKIGFLAFNGCTGLAGVDIPATVSTIGDAAFAGCSSLKYAAFKGDAPANFGIVVFGDELTYIGDFLIIFEENATGFTTPTWNYYKTVCRIRATGVTLSKETLSLTTGGSAVLTATVAPEGVFDGSVSWASSDESVASVTQNAIDGAKATVKAIKAGSAIITVATTDGAFTAQCAVTVSSPAPPPPPPPPAKIKVTGVSLDRIEAEMTVGDTLKLTQTVAPANATDKSVSWQSSSAAVAAVDASGNVSAVSDGRAVITVKTTDGSFTASCAITVNKKKIEATGVSLDKESLELTEGDAARLTATVFPEDATDKTVIWTSADAGVATVDENGGVTAVAPGETSITVRTADGGFTASCAVTVKSAVVPVTGIELDAAEMILREGASRTLAASVLPENATDKTVIWSSADEKIASVDALGRVTALALGETSITAATQDGGFSASCNVTVSRPLERPVLRAAAVTANSLRLAWTKIENATGYVLVRKAAGETAWTNVINTRTGTAFVDASVVPGTKYYYMVKAVNTEWKESSRYSALAPITAQPARVAGLTLVSGAAKRTTLKWSAARDVTGYEIARYDAASKAWRIVAETAKTSFVDISTKRGATYYYRVRAYKAAGGRRVFGAYSERLDVKAN